MAWPITFNSLTNPQPLQDFDTMFNAVAGVISIPSTASGTNAISLTPVTNSPALPAYSELCGARFRAVGTSSGPVTAQINGLGFLPVYHADGATQASTGDLISGEQYVVTFSQALNGGAGGFFLESPSAPVVTTPWFTPGGRLTLQSATPVMVTNQLTPQIIYYAPYASPFVPIYNGSTIQTYQFTSSLADQVGLQLNMGGGAQWTASLPFDIFAYLNAGVPALCAIKWTNGTTRATTLSVFGGFLTNSGLATAFTGPATTVTLPVNQGTFLGTIFTSGTAGQGLWQYAGSASGGTPSFLYVCNYYNKVLFTSTCTDSGVSYTYTSSSTRLARASGNNSHNFIQSDSERAIIATASAYGSLTNVTGSLALTGIGINSAAAFSAFQLSENAANLAALQYRVPVIYQFSGTGFFTANRLEASDGTNANTFDNQANDQLGISLWL